LKRSLQFASDHFTVHRTKEATTVHGKQIWRKIEQAYWSKLKSFRTDKSLFEFNPSPNSLFFNYDTQVMIQVKLHELKNSSEQALVNYLIIWFIGEEVKREGWRKRNQFVVEKFTFAPIICPATEAKENIEIEITANGGDHLSWFPLFIVDYPIFI